MMKLITADNAPEELLEAANIFLDEVNDKHLNIGGCYNMFISKELFPVVESFGTLLYKNGALLSQMKLDEAVVEAYQKKIYKIARDIQVIFIASEIWEKNYGSGSSGINSKNCPMWRLLEGADDDCTEILSRSMEKDREIQIAEIVDEAKQSGNVPEYLHNKHHFVIGIASREDARLIDLCFHANERKALTLRISKAKETIERYEIVIEAARRLNESGDFDEAKNQLIDFLQFITNQEKEDLARCEGFLNDLDKRDKK
jgi:hypothetical protein